MRKDYFLGFGWGTLMTLLLFFGNDTSFAQGMMAGEQSKTEFKLHAKGEYFVTWGYNRAWFDRSDIHFTGQGHDFVLYDVKAVDRPSAISWDYVNPSTWSIPQFNFRVGYFLSDKYSISLGWDHMKYVAENYQQVKMYGTVDPNGTVDEVMGDNMAKLNAKYATNGHYNNVDVLLDPLEFLSYEHTDGFNYASLDVERYDQLWQSKSCNKVGISVVSGLGSGIIVPRTDAHLFGSGRNHFWNIAGWGANAKVGVQLSLTRHLYLESNLKYGFVRMQDVHTSNHYTIDKAQQDVVFYENNWLLGFRF